MSLEPTLHDVHLDLVNRLEQDKRLRAVEQQQAATNSEVSNLRGDIQRLEKNASEGFADLKAFIADSKPKVWPAVSAIVAAVAVLFGIAQAVYAG